MQQIQIGPQFLLEITKTDIHLYTLHTQVRRLNSELSNKYLSEPLNTDERISPGKPGRCPNNLITYNGYICKTVTIAVSVIPTGRYPSGGSIYWPLN